jgi:hypothetical protein
VSSRPTLPAYIFPSAVRQSSEQSAPCPTVLTDVIIEVETLVHVDSRSPVPRLGIELQVKHEGRNANQCGSECQTARAPERRLSSVTFSKTILPC